VGLAWISGELEMGVPAGVSRSTAQMGERLGRERDLHRIYQEIVES